MYPCDCENSKFIMDNYDVIKDENNAWMLNWLELDKTNKGTNIQRLGIRVKYCMFCGKKLKRIKED